MSSDLFFENKKYISAKDAAHLTSYTSDYVGQLCRANKVESKKIGRTWYVSEESILNHKNLGMELFVEEKISPLSHIETKKQKINLSGRAPFLPLVKIPELSKHIQKAHKKIFSYNPNF